MGHLADTTIEDLRRALDSIEDNVPAKRLFAAIAYKHGVPQTELAKWFDVQRKTIYNWLNRIDEGDLATAIQNDPRTGRPRKLTVSEFNALESVLLNPPEDSGYNEPAWSTSLVREYIRDRFDINYSRPSCRRLMKEIGLNHYPPRDAAREFDERDIAHPRATDQLGHVWLPW